MAMVQFIETTESKLSSVSVKAGQLLFTAGGKAYFDSSSNQRVELTDLAILATDAARTGLTNPVVNKFYFVTATSKLYLYSGSWVLINKDAEKYTLPVATSSALGGVKSGTDITVDASGNVTVNNNSHTHTIANITNLQSTLNNKETAGAAAAALAEAKGYADTVGANVKNEILGGAGEAFDTLVELAALIADNEEAIEALSTIASGKADKSHTHKVADITDLTVSAAELNYMSGAASNIQTQLDAKSDSDHTHSYAGSNTVGGAANSANKLNTDAGDENTPVYFKNGVPVPVTSISVDTEGNAETATSLATARKITLAGDASGNVSFDGSSDVTLTVTVKDDSHAHVIGNVDGLQAALDGKSDSGHTHNYAGSDTVGGAANSANKLNTDAGDEHTPVYFVNGVPVAITSISVDVEGNSETASSLSTPRKITLAGDVTGEVSFDGTKDVTLTATIADDSHNHTIANVDGLQAALNNKETAGAAAQALEDAKSYADGVKADILGGAGEAYDTLVELGTLIDENEDAIKALETVATGKADKVHSHKVADITDLTATAAELNYMDGVTSSVQTQLNSKAASDHTHSAYVNQNAFSNVKVGSTTVSADTATDTLTLVAGSNVTITPDATNDKITIAATDTTYSAATANAAGLMSAADKAKLDTIDEGANNFTMPIAGMNFGAVKTTSLLIEVGDHTPCPIVDGVPYYKTDKQYTLASFNITASATEINKLSGATISTEELNYLDGVTSSIQTQLNRKAASDHTHDAATNTTAGFMSAADKKKLGTIDEGANNYTLPTATSSKLGGVTTTSSVTNPSGYTACPIISGVPYYKNTDTTYTLSSFGITATAAELNKLDGVTATTQELNYVDGVTSNIQTQLNAKADADHSHAYAAVASDGVSAASAARLVVDAGDANTPVYFKDGVPTTCSSDLTVDTKGNAATATALQTARKITLAGDATGNVTFDGSSDVTLTVAVKDDSHAHVIGNVDGLQAALDAKETAGAAATALTQAKSYADTVGANVKNEILGGAGEAYDTLVELSELITDNTDAIDALETVAAGKADKVHSHDAATTSAAGFMSVADKTKLDGIATGANKYSHPTYTAKTSGLYKVTVDGTGHVSAATAVAKSDITALGIPAQDTTYSAATTSAAGLMSTADKTKLNGIATGAEVNQNAFSNVTVGSTTIAADSKTDTLTLVAGTNVTITPDATNDKITIAATDTTYSAASTSAAGLMSAADKAKLDGIAANANNYTYTLPTAGSSLGGVKTTSTVTSTSGLTPCPIISGVPYYKDTNDTYTLSSFGITATAAELNKLDGVTATTAELNYVDGVTSNIQTQLNAKAASDHTHSAYVNQNAFSNVTVGSTTIAADTTTDTLTLVAGSNVTITPDATNDKITIAATDTTYSAASTSAAGLMSASDKTKLNATNTAYGTCSTAAATAAKVVTVSGNTNWTLSAGSMVTVVFSATNTASNPTLNVNGTGAKNIFYNGSQITTSSLGMAGTISVPMTFTYDGTNYVFTSWGKDNNTTYTNVKLGHGYATCSTAAATTAKVASLSSYTLATGGIVAVKFTYAVPAGSTLNINSKGAKAIYYKGKAIVDGVIGAGELALFMYNGSQYHLLAVDGAWDKTVKSSDVTIASEASIQALFA